MKAGDRVELTEDMEDLRAGSIGIVGMAESNHTPYMFTGVKVKRIGVLFDGLKNPAVFRRVMVKGKIEPVQVVTKCKLING